MRNSFSTESVGELQYYSIRYHYHKSVYVKVRCESKMSPKYVMNRSILLYNVFKKRFDINVFKVTKTFTNRS